MICSKCAHDCEPYPRIRYTPTYFHHPIFEGPLEQHKPTTKCSATYHSTVFDQAQPGKCCRNSLSKPDNQQNNQQPEPTNNRPESARPVSAGGHLALKKQVSFNPNSSTKFEKAGDFNPISNHMDMWYNHEKLRQMRDGVACTQHGISRERKLVELSSTPLYDLESLSRTEVVRPQATQQPAEYPQLRQQNNNHGEVSKVIGLQNIAGQPAPSQQPLRTDNPVQIPRQLPQKVQVQPRVQSLQQPKKVATFQQPQKALVSTLKSTAKPATTITGTRKTKITNDNVRKPQPVFKSVTRRR